jgi:uncharacterized protein (DUF1697 family)
MTKSSNAHNMVAFVAFLRGINVGGNKLIPMDDLKKAFAALGFANVTTILASGNVVFASKPAGEQALAGQIEEKLRKTFRTEIGVLVRRVEDLRRLDASQPFKGLPVTPQTRLYVTFLSEKPASKFKAPYTSPDKSLRILRLSPTEVCTALTLSPMGGTVDLMAFLQKEFGKKITTRNWNTIQRILKAAVAMPQTGAQKATG